jgi:hypothetical protein
MMLRILVSACVVVAISVPAAAQLQITIDTNGNGAETLVDSDANGVVDFDTTVGSVLQAQGQVKQIVEGINAKLVIAPLPPSTDALFRNVSAVQQTITVTVKSGTLPVPIAPPLGWDIFYNADVDDPIDGIADVPTHSVEAFAGGGSILLGNVTGIPLSAAATVSQDNHGVDTASSTSDAWIVWSFTLGPNDEFLVPSDGGFDGESIQVNVFNQQQKCTDKMNNGARKIAAAAEKADTKCVSATIGAATSCVDADDDVKTIKKQQKLISNFDAHCDPVPAWGVKALSCCFGGGTNDGDVCVDSSSCGGGTCARGGCIAESADSGANELTHDLYGASVTVSADSRTRRCQHTVSKSVSRLLVEEWKAFRLCKRDQFAAIGNDVDLVSTCLQPEPDPKGKIAKREAQVSSDIQSKCLDKSVSGLGVVFPGACSGEPDGAFGTCLAQRARCRFCGAANEADAIVPELDCDLFDDGVINSSCVP